MGQPKSKRAAMLDPRHRAMLLKEKYRQQLAERQEPESDSAETQAVDEVEGAADWAVDTVQDRAAQVPRVRQKPPIKEKSSASIPHEHKANEQTAASREPPARYTAPKSKNFLETPSAEEARPLNESEREELIRLRAENEYIKAENEVIKKEIALREERHAAQLKARKQRSSKSCVKKDTN